VSLEIQLYCSGKDGYSSSVILSLHDPVTDERGVVSAVMDITEQEGRRSVETFAGDPIQAIILQVGEFLQFINDLEEKGQTFFLSDKNRTLNHPYSSAIWKAALKTALKWSS
jgi:hypothetical protein